MNRDRDSRRTNTGRSPFAGTWAASAAHGAWRVGPMWYAFEDGMTNPVALRAQLERLHPKPLKAQFSK